MQSAFFWALTAWTFAVSNVHAQSSSGSSSQSYTTSASSNDFTWSSTSASLCLATSIVNKQAVNGSTFDATTVINGTCPDVRTTTATQPSYSVYTLAPWLSTASETTVSQVETFVISQSTILRSKALPAHSITDTDFCLALYFAVPAPTSGSVSNNVGCPAPTTVTVSVVSCPTTGGAVPLVPGAASNVAIPANTGIAQAGSGQADSGQVGSGQQSVANGGVPVVAGGFPIQAAATTTLTKAITSSYLSTITSYSTYTVASTQTQYYTITGVAGAVTSSRTSVVTSVVTSTIYQPSTVTVTITTTLTQTDAIGTTQTGGVPTSETVPTTLTVPRYLNGSITMSAPTFVQPASTNIPIESQTTITSPSATVNTPIESQTSTNGGGFPIVVPGIPGQGSTYDLEESELLAAISFPKGFNCNKKLVILQPGTAVPAIDTFSNTFIPVFENEATIAEVGEVDIMLITVPTISLGPAWQTAEYIAYAMDYANLVLKRPGTIIAWSQGNLNVQWAFKYWPSTRTDVEGRNYVAISADYDGTILGSFLCQPISILTSGSGATLIEQFIANNGLNVILTALGLSAMPMSGTAGMTDPEAFKAILLNFVYGPAATQGLGGGVMGSTSTTSAAAAVVTKRAVPFGNREDVVRILRAQADKVYVEKRQASLLTPVVDLVGGIADPILQELSTIIVDPAAPLAQIFANLAKLAVDPGNLSLPPTGCAPAVWDQVYGSNFVNKLAENGGSLAYVPTTSIFSLTDEVVQPQGITGKTAASAFLPGSNAGAPAPENIYIQEHCTVVRDVLLGDAPPLITHEGVLASGMGVSAAILAVMSGSTVSYDEIVSRYGANEACAILSDRLTAADYLGNEATIPGALLRVTVGPGTDDPDAQFISEERALPAYANNA
ncbi:putative Lipase [Taphrina deformans PYCC 5710]|uniref:Lipase n=1 Tax=Taphrina deformans (strain PYCC 5710 / ATCC 11124 / CBS 356.35 / IMI 108563 / JCM 9778 / NBRC 8474) TaxID=1097556 RepID=R4XB56_TAPDE|nr:putative Lipase [Taphrina deformans PYCC 5710]|eukprot:CCG82835.1 putative Lipase [Taphrina deformans PYCC 5710]